MKDSSIKSSVFRVSSESFMHMDNYMPSPRPYTHILLTLLGTGIYLPTDHLQHMIHHELPHLCMQANTHRHTISQFGSTCTPWRKGERRCQIDLIHTVPEDTSHHFVQIIPKSHTSLPYVFLYHNCRYTVKVLGEYRTSLANVCSCPRAGKDTIPKAVPGPH